MPRKVFLSFLGTNNYLECNYYIEADEQLKAPGVKYVQEALLQLYARDFGETDDCYFFLTQAAERQNWQDNGQYNPKTSQYDLPNEGLQTRLAKLREAGDLHAQVHPVSIPDGFSEKEVWEIFSRVFGCLEEGDEVILDITHAFRSLPMLGMVLIHYGKALRNIQVRGIYYGAFEKLGPASVVRNWDLSDRNAPILDLNSLAELQEWTTAAMEFEKYGSPEPFNQLTQTAIGPILREAKGKDETANQLRNFSGQMRELVALIQTNRGKGLMDFSFEKLKNSLEGLADQDYVVPLNPIIDRVKEKLGALNLEGPVETRWLRSVHWCMDHGLIQQGITQLQEGILTYLCFYLEEMKLKPGYFQWDDETARNHLSAVLSLAGRGVSEQHWTGVLAEKRELSRVLFSIPLIKRLAPTYDGLGDSRNDINHGGYTKTKKAEAFHKGLKKYTQAIEAIITEFPLSGETSRPDRSFLLNLSNHPSSVWGDKQQSKAKELYGEIQDLPFPAIDPTLAEEELQELVGEYFEKIVRMRPQAVHLMGEMTFTFCLVRMLKMVGIPCIASTSLRQVKEEAGKKQVIFEFSRFRAYC
jgi:CRISPR-associated Csx2 family protein